MRQGLMKRPFQDRRFKATNGKWQLRHSLRRQRRRGMFRTIPGNADPWDNDLPLASDRTGRHRTLLQGTLPRWEFELAMALNDRPEIDVHRDALRAYLVQGVQIKEAARRHGITYKQLAGWAESLIAEALAIDIEVG